jgi:hypothetical protein
VTRKIMIRAVIMEVPDLNGWFTNVKKMGKAKNASPIIHYICSLTSNL